MSEVHVIDHPLVISNLTRMRDERTSSATFRALLEQVTVLMGYEVTRNLPTRLERITTPIEEAELPVLDVDAVTLSPILRAGVGMVEGMLKILPNASIGYIGMYRDEVTFKPVEYLCKLPTNISESTVIVLDPMLATGGSAVDAVNALKAHGARDLRMMNIVAAPVGIATFQEAHPDVDIFTAAIDKGLNERAYIVPGLGDAGDRIFGTE